MGFITDFSNIGRKIQEWLYNLYKMEILKNLLLQFKVGKNIEESERVMLGKLEFRNLPPNTAPIRRKYFQNIGC